MKVGDSIFIYVEWEDTRKWYPAIVKNYNEDTGLVTAQYSDGAITKEKFDPEIMYLPKTKRSAATNEFYEHRLAIYGEQDKEYPDAISAFHQECDDLVKAYHSIKKSDIPPFNPNRPLSAGDVVATRIPATAAVELKSEDSDSSSSSTKKKARRGSKNA
jgi:hypothetical protein